MECRFPAMLVLWLGRELYSGMYGKAGRLEPSTPDIGDKPGETTMATSRQIWRRNVGSQKTELKTRRQKPGESLQVSAADVERFMSLAYAECPLDVREILPVQFFIDPIIDEDTQLLTRLMDFTDFKSALAYSIKYEAAKIASKISMHARPIEIEDNTCKEKLINWNC
ncbi:hypothetical protein AVEN_270501-1 [Araneus ventricosus]|uniref:Uncharacterized protein n=1 Tax=Araneus ventricosus TaxID=182803 RepID=A0A4Y2B714_ARAVE|nr:hypothetical protein AVEN_270501-1 [Araneus ventricosus]